MSSSSSSFSSSSGSASSDAQFSSIFHAHRQELRHKATHDDLKGLVERQLYGGPEPPVLLKDGGILPLPGEDYQEVPEDRDHQVARAMARDLALNLLFSSLRPIIAQSNKQTFDKIAGHINIALLEDYNARNILPASVIHVGADLSSATSTMHILKNSLEEKW
jgi:hypothetical protein